MAKAKLPDGKVMEVPDGASVKDVAAKIGPRLADAAVAAKVDDRLVDLATPLAGEHEVRIVTPKDPEALEILRHTTTHVMAQAVRRLFGDQVQYTIGPALTEDFQYGFYYDFDFPDGVRVTEGDLERIEAEMQRIVDAKLPLARKVESTESAKRELLDEHHQRYKDEMIEDLVRGEGVKEVSLYRQGEFLDMCRGPHLPDTGKIPAFKLLATAGAYWRGDEHNKQLTRIYGTAFFSRKELEEHLARIEEAKRRDHRKLGKELEIFAFDDEVGPGLPLWLPAGGVIIEELERLAKQVEAEAGYLRVRTPHVTKEDLFIRSGHLPYYAESMYPPMELEGVKYYVKPMNCPFHHKIFSSRTRSYRDLPIRLAEYGACYRYEKSGELTGLLRVRSMQMNDAHIYCAEDQFEDEFIAVVRMYERYFKLFGIEKFVMRFSTHAKAALGKKYVDNERLWLKTEDMVRRTLIGNNVPYVEVADEAAFYGPKIDVQIWSAVGREFTLATNQVDFAVPGRFNLVFVNRNNEEETPLCIHRAPLSTHERMIGFLIEHYAGNFPAWLAPEQARLVPITDAQNEYAEKVRAQLAAAGVRASVDTSSERMNAKIRKAQKMKIPYMLVVGAKEADAGTVSVRERAAGDVGAMKAGEFVAKIADEIATRALHSTLAPAKVS
ncbi:MAG: Threonine--tRNA ligase [Phycisphaerae bacterium]|nr:Threonine--tRNA ligase [Phycisphaerae bacterium]